MFGFKKSPNKVPKHKNPSADQDSDPARRTSSEPMLITPNSNDDLYANSGGLESQSTQELERYAVKKSEDTTRSVNNCLKIAENIREDAGRTLDMLHQQGDQIERTHRMAANMDEDLSKGEKLLNSLGGMFSKTWKPKKTRDITGPLITADAKSGTEYNKEQREKLRLGGKGGSRTPPPEPISTLQKVEVEKTKQDDSLSDLSNILGDLKGMAADMGSELDRQNKALDHLSDDMEELNSRVKGSNQRTRKLLGR